MLSSIMIIEHFRCQRCLIFALMPQRLKNNYIITSFVRVVQGIVRPTTLGVVLLISLKSKP